MDSHHFGHTGLSPHFSESNQRDVAQSPNWRHRSPHRLDSNWMLQSTPGTGSPWRMSPPWTWGMPSPSGISVGLSLHGSTSNSILYDHQSNFPQPGADINYINWESPSVQPCLLNLTRTPLGSFVVPSSENIASRQSRTVTPGNMSLPNATVEEDLPPIVFTRSRFSNEEWERHRPQIQKLWLDQGKPLDETKQYMAAEFNFNPS